MVRVQPQANEGRARRSEVLTWVEVVSEFLLGAYRRGIHGENWISAATIHVVHYLTPSPTPKASGGGVCCPTTRRVCGWKTHADFLF